MALVAKRLRRGEADPWGGEDSRSGESKAIEKERCAGYRFSSFDFLSARIFTDRTRDLIPGRKSLVRFRQKVR